VHQQIRGEGKKQKMRVRHSVAPIAGSGTQQEKEKSWESSIEG
jgi:hypothetical protein